MDSHKRVFTLAKELGLSSKDLMDKLAKLGIEVKSHMAVLTDEDAAKLMSHLAPAKHAAKAAHPAKPPAEKPHAEKAEKPHAPKAEKAAEPAKPAVKAAHPHPAKTQPEKVAEKVAAKVPEKIEKVIEAKPAVPKQAVKPAAPAKPAPELIIKEKKPEPVQTAPLAPEPVKTTATAVAEKEPEAPAAPAAAPKILKRVKVPEGVTVSQLAQKVNLRPVELIKKLISQGIMATLNQKLDVDVANLIASENGYELDFVPYYGEAFELAEDEKDNPADLKPRAPVVTIMGHVDHGKTSLLDAIRMTNVTAGEAGGITQHIGAYKVSLPNKGDVVFLDTPGHEAFTAMRARGASITDVIVLVVAADDGVMPQTIEAIHHAQSSKTPIMVAINKIDKEGVNINRIKQQLSDHGLMPEDWGGKTIMVEVSAKKKLNLDKLLEMLLLEAEMLELKANPHAPAKGTVIEAKLDKNRGPVATILVEKGTLKVGDTFIAGACYGKVRALANEHGQRLLSAGPATPVEILGLSGIPQAGDKVQVLVNEKMGRYIAAKRQEQAKEHELSLGKRITLDDLYSQIQQGKIKELKIIIKADVSGSVEVLRHSLEALSNEKVKLHVVYGGVGNITESDVMLASAANAIIVGFNVKTEPQAQTVVAREKVDVRFYRIIYDIVNDVKAAMEGLLEPHFKETLVGRAEVRQIFKTSKEGTVAGCYVTAGKITRSGQMKVARSGEVAFEGKLASLKRFKDDVSEVAAGFECGIRIDGLSDLRIGDFIESFVTETVIQKLS